MTEQQKNDTITIKKDALWKYSTFVLLAIVIIAAVVMFTGNSLTTGNVIANNNNNLPTQPSQVNAKLSADDNYIKGSFGGGAKVTVVEYSDFECPFCARAYTDAVAGIKSSYSDEDVAMVYRHFPLTSIHHQAQKAAEASECAGEQGKFIEMHDMLFEQGVSGSVESFKQYASTLGLDTTKFNSCLDTGKYAKEIQDDLKEGSSQGVQGTPGFLIIVDGKGTIISGAQPFTVFKQAIDAALA